MTTIEEYQDRCEQLFLAGGNAAVRRAAQKGLDELGPQADLYCWLALGHAAEDDDDHDDLAEEAFRAGLALDAEHLGLLAGYAELCLRADSFDHPGRTARAAGLSRRLKELSPDSAEAERVAAVEHWARRGYWDELRMSAAAAAVAGRWTEEQARVLTDDLRHGADPTDPGATGAPAGSSAPGERTAHRDAVVRAATLETLSGPWNAPVRFLGRHRTRAWSLCVVLCILTNTVLRQTGAVESFSFWGFLWLVPMLLVDRRFAAARQVADARHIAHLEAALGKGDHSSTGSAR